MTRTNLTPVNVASLSKLTQAAEQMIAPGGAGWLHVTMRVCGFDGEKPQTVDDVDLVVTQSTREFQLRIEFTYHDSHTARAEKATFWLSWEDGKFSGDFS